MQKIHTDLQEKLSPWESSFFPPKVGKICIYMHSLTNSCTVTKDSKSSKGQSSKWLVDFSLLFPKFRDIEVCSEDPCSRNFQVLTKYTDF